jgi:hypothetical protein
MKITTVVTFLNKNEDEIHSLALANNYQGIVLISNQCDQVRTYSFSTPKADITVYEAKTRGVSKARNAMAVLCQTELINFADDDVVFVDDFESKVNAAFEKHPEADVIRFNAQSLNEKRPIPQINAEKKLRFRDLNPYGAWSCFIKTSFLKTHPSILFDEKCGPGTPIVHGEDTLYLFSLCHQKACLWEMPQVIMSIGQKDSTWAENDEEKHIIADGYLYRKMLNPLLVNPIGFLHFVKLRKKGIHKTLSWKTIRQLYRQGIKLAK